MTNEVLICPKCESRNVTQFTDVIKKDRTGNELVSIPVRRCEYCKRWDTLLKEGHLISYKFSSDRPSSLSIFKDEEAKKIWESWVPQVIPELQSCINKIKSRELYEQNTIGVKS